MRGYIKAHACVHTHSHNRMGENALLYRSFKARIKQADNTDNALLLSMWHLQSWISQSTHADFMLYWPKENAASFLGLSHTCVDERSSRPESNKHVFVILPLIFIRQHMKQQQQTHFTNCSRTNDEDYCYFAHKAYDREEWLPLTFIITLYNSLFCSVDVRKRRPSSVETLPITHLFTRPIVFNHKSVCLPLFLSLPLSTPSLYDYLFFVVV